MSIYSKNLSSWQGHPPASPTLTTGQANPLGIIWISTPSLPSMSTSLAAPYRNPMSKVTGKRKKPSTYHFGPSDAGSSDSTRATNSKVLREKTRVRQSDGHVTQARVFVDVAAAPREPATRVHPDVRRERPIYDWYSGGDVDVDRGDEDSGDVEEEEGRQPRSLDHPLRQWAEDHLATYLAESLRLDGRGDYQQHSSCRVCGKGKADHRCRNCLAGGELLCRTCIVAAHRSIPFHVIEIWTGTMFERQTLKQLGLRIQLGHWHDLHRVCPVPTPATNDDFVIVDIHGVLEVGLDYCGCGQGGHPTVQLLRAQLWPATTTSPKTAATFAVLRQYHLLSFESKCSALEFYQSLARQTDNLGLKKRWKSNEIRGKTRDQLKDRYHEFLRMTREWRHENAPEDKQFLDAVFLAIDANFRLIRKDVSTEERDPGLGKGYAFYEDVDVYMSHVRRNWNQKQDRSHCVAHDAVDKPDREARGTASSGIGAVDCARHNMKRPLAVGDLQLGERYINMDYMFFRSIVGLPLLRFFISYNIACQWHINIWRRLSAYQDPSITTDREPESFKFLVPKFHLPAHIEACNLKFSFHLTRDVGQTDGEAPERRWANANPLARSTREMGPGARRDTLDDHFNDWNHKKIIALGITLAKKVEVAVEEMVRTREALADLEESLGTESVVQWTEMATRWEADIDAPNPFETQHKDKHVAKVRAELAVEAAAREAAGTEAAGAVRGDMHITELVGMGLQLEDQQRVLGSDVASTGLHPTDGQRRAMIERTSKLRRKIFAWIEVQTKFFPAPKNIREVEDNTRAQMGAGEPILGIAVSDVKLWLPSAIAVASQEEVPVDTETYQHEYRLRVGQAQEALHEVRRLLLVRTHLYKLKDTHSRGVRANMRSNDKIAALNGQVQRAAEQYRAARRALEGLGRVLKRTEWQRTLRELKPDDVRGLPKATFHDPERKKKGKTSRRRRKKQKKEREMSWIWVAQGGHDPADPPSMNEAVRIEWAKVRARCHRWREEVDLLEAEMDRVKRYLVWRAQWWQGQVGRKTALEDAQLEGESAYALRQAKTQARLGECFAEDWKALPDLILRGRAGGLGKEDEDDVVAAVEEDDENSEGEDESDEEEAPIGSLPQREIKASYVDEVLSM
ncbi:hypothetical protein B0H14DRAFT_3589450 [Mycena olivaceomarginata]|nr:hypothetical protein B0H14DRAFT_3589450 [Mycena olivaceomarginata]